MAALRRAKGDHAFDGGDAEQFLSNFYENPTTVLAQAIDRVINARIDEADQKLKG